MAPAWTPQFVENEQIDLYLVQMCPEGVPGPPFDTAAETVAP